MTEYSDWSESFTELQRHLRIVEAAAASQNWALAARHAEWAVGAAQKVVDWLKPKVKPSKPHQELLQDALDSGTFPNVR